MLGRLRRNFNEIRREIEQEIGADEIRRELHNESILADLKKGSDSLRSGIEETRREISDLGNVGANEDSQAKTTPAEAPANPVDDTKQ